MALPAPLKRIPITDIRESGVARYALDGADRARALRDDCLTFLPRAASPLIPLLDRIARRWLMRSYSPYVAEIASIAAALGFPGVWLLNGSYQWACTALAREEGGRPWIARTLDWPFRGLGRHVEVARKRGPAGEFLSVTWPGYVGTLTAMAPGRFAACINQAPLWRRTRHPWLRIFDVAVNALNTWRLREIPPDQLLRLVFETCPDFESARHKLQMTPISRPVIFVLVGCAPGQSCVIERTERGHWTRADATAVANDWLESRAGWEARVAGTGVLTRTPQAAAERSRARQDALAAFAGTFASHSFSWITEPVLNACTRIGVEMCPATGVIRVVGYDKVPGLELPQQVTAVCEVEAPMAA